MKIVEIPGYFYPEQMSSTQMDDDRYRAFAKAGFETELYAATPTRNVTDEVRSKYKKKRIEKMYNGQMTVHRYSLYREGKNPVLRAFRYLLQCVKQFNRALFSKDARKCELVFTGSTPPVKGAMVALVKKFRKIKFVYNLHDIFPDSLVGSGLVKKGGLLWKIGRVIENFTYRNADKIIVISEDFKRNIMEKGVPEDKIVVVYNWVDTERVHPVVKEENPLYDEFGIYKDKFNVVYAGNLGNAQNVMLLVEAAEKLKEDDSIQFIIFGTGGIEQELKTAVNENNLNNVKLLPLQPMERVPFVYGVGDVCVVACKEGLGGSAMPSKTWTIMSCGKAVIANFDEGELKHIIEENNCGIFTKAGDVDAFVDAIKELKINPGKCAEMGKKGRVFVLDNLNKDICTQKYVEVIKSFEKK